MARLTCVLLVLSLTRLAWAQGEERPPAAEVLGLDEAVGLALQNNRSVRNAALQVDRSEQNVGAAKALRWPSLQLQVLAGTTVAPVRMSFPGGAFGDFPATGPIPPVDTVVEVPRALSAYVNGTLAQPLSQLYKINLGVKVNELTREIDREKLRDERASVVSAVKRLYYSILQTRSALTAAEEQVKSYRELVRVVGESLAREAALPSDRLDAQAGLAAAEYRALALRNGLATQKEQMNDLLGRELTRDFTPAALPAVSPDEADLEAGVARALERRPDLKQARLQVDQADADRRLKKADSIPDLSLALTYFTFANVDLLPRNVAQVGLQLKWEPLDWGKRGKEVAEKTLQLEQARSAAREAEDRVRIDVANAFRKLQEARLRLEANRLARDSAREKARVAADRYEHEAALLKDVLQAQGALADADAQYDEALLGLWTAKADLGKAVGEEQ
jgi:outer membrane protein TolC